MPNNPFDFRVHYFQIIILIAGTVLICLLVLMLMMAMFLLDFLLLSSLTINLIIEIFADFEFDALMGDLSIINANTKSD